MAEQDTANSAALGQSDFSSLENVRLRRAHRYAAANQLIRLAKNVEPEVAKELISGVDNAVLDTLPHWCLLDDAPVLTLQQVCAAIFLAPSLQQSIDGSLINGWRQCFGSTLFDAVLTEEPIAKLSEIPPLPEASESLMDSTGASVLLSTLLNNPSQILFEQRTGHYNGLVDRDLAMRIYLAATALHQRMQEHIADSEQI